MKHKKWTAEEDKIVTQAVKENFDNLQETFRDLAIQLDRTASAISARWYKVLSNPDSKSYVGIPCFMGFGIKKRYTNRKNYIEKYSKQYPKKSPNTIWRTILKILGIHQKLCLNTFKVY